MNFIETIADLLSGQRDQISIEDFVGMHFTVDVKRGPQKGKSKSYIATGVTKDGQLAYKLANDDSGKEILAFFPAAPVFADATLYLGEAQLEAVRRSKQVRARRAKIDIDPNRLRAATNAEKSKRIVDAAVGAVEHNQGFNGRDVVYALIDIYPDIASGRDAESEATLSFLIDVHGRMESGQQSGLSDRQYKWVRDVVERYGRRQS